MDNQQIELKDIKNFIRRQKKGFIITCSLIVLSAMILAFALPPVYRASATIVIEEQQIPKDYVKSTITSYADERLKNIKEHVMSRSRLKEIIEKYNLYPELRQTHTVGDIISQMRNSITLESESAKITNPRTGKKITVTIAFILSYEGKDPANVKKITNLLAELFLEEDVRMREKLTSVTTSFLEEELDNLKKQILHHENKISLYKQAHLGELPEYNSINLQSIARLEREMDRIDGQVRTLEEKKIQLRGQLASVDPLKPIIVNGKNVAANPRDRLKGLRLELVSLQAKLSDRHPDVKRLKREIRKLESQSGVPEDSGEKTMRLRELKQDLANLKARLGKKHPDVRRLAREVRLLSAELNKAPARSYTAEKNPDNPAYISLRTQITATQAEIRNLLRDKDKIRYELRKYQKRVETAPLVEKEYNELTRDYYNAKDKYNEIMKKLMAARVAKGMEDTQRGERFTIKNRAYQPRKPYKPNRMAIIFLGAVFASVLGFGLAATQEFLDHSVKTENDLRRVTDLPVLSVISMVETREEKWGKWMRRILFCLIIAALIAGALYLADSHIMPLDDLWIKLKAKIVKK